MPRTAVVAVRGLFLFVISSAAVAPKTLGFLRSLSLGQNDGKNGLYFILSVSEESDCYK